MNESVEMAEACRLGLKKTENKLTNSQEENICILNVLCVFVSLVTILADLTTDLLVLAEYCNNGHLFWAFPTLIFIVVPNILINIFSIRWFATDQTTKVKHWISHLFLVGFLERYMTFLHQVFVCKNFEPIESQKLMSQRNDLSLLHFLYIFTGTVPQVILQSYAIVTLDENYYTKAFALTASIASIVWGCGNYIYSILVFSNETFQWKSLLLQLVWHFSMLLSRISSILLFTTVFGIWTLIPLGLHWSAMTFWIIIQKTTFCSNKLEETLYNVVMGFVYCFCYINLREGHTRYRLLVFYTLIVIQNFGTIFIYVLITDMERLCKAWSIVSTVFIIGGTIIGLSAMTIYYRYFHSKGPIEWKLTQENLELNNKTATSAVKRDTEKGNIRCFKTLSKDPVKNNANDVNPVVGQESKNDAHNADKKFLLDHWIARSGTPTFSSVPVGNNSFDVSSIELYTVENTPHMALQNEDTGQNDTNKINTKNYKIKICSPTELNLKLSSIENLESSIDEITTNNLNLQKRRGICFSDELRNDLTHINLDLFSERFIKSLKADHNSEISQDTDGSNKKTSSDSIDMDLDLSFSDINSSDINTFNENIVQKLCLSALKNIKVGNQDADIQNIQRIALDILKEMYAKKGFGKSVLTSDSLLSKQRDLETPSEVLSVHDYENICAVNIAREAWGLRSWNGYSDIENWLHDGSVVRDRRRDTLTSGSSEISSCLSQELKNAILSAPSFPKKTPTYSNVFVKFERSSQEDYVNAVICHSNDDTFLAKPCMTDINKDPNHLEPILEELDDLNEQPSKKRLNSESSLVATIDEIRKVTVTNSPRNLYHRREHVWDSPQFDASVKIGSTLKKALWKEPSKFDSSNIMESLPEKENILNVSHGIKFELKQKDLNLSNSSTSSNVKNPDMGLIYNQSIKRRIKSSLSSSKNQVRSFKNKPEHNLQDLSNKDIDLLWQIVTVNSLPQSSSEDLYSNRISSSLQSLIHKDTSSSNAVCNPVPKINNIKKGARSRPRRKFSILRERFEPHVNSTNSDEEMLYHCSKNPSTHLESIVNVKNNFSVPFEKHSISKSKTDTKTMKKLKTECVKII